MVHTSLTVQRSLRRTITTARVRSRRDFDCRGFSAVLKPPLRSSLEASTTVQTTTLGRYADPSRYLAPHPSNNITPHIASLVGRDLHLLRSHPIGIIRAKIQEYFSSLSHSTGTDYKIFDAEDPIVTCQQCFDDLLIPPDHPGRAPSDTYYVTESTLLRTHTSAHQSQHLRSGVDAFLCSGDVYRRDEIDVTHYPVFHQMEGVKLIQPSLVDAASGLSGEEWLESSECSMVESDLKSTLEGLMDHLFGPHTHKRWNVDFFPFTQPSFELEIYHNDEWMEVLGCGVSPIPQI
jgi:phenylalanyl-tRNA synthetase alpha chain